MCDVCRKEFRGWVESFTRAERILVVLEALLLASFFVVLILLLLHLAACSRPPVAFPDATDAPPPSTDSAAAPTASNAPRFPGESRSKGTAGESCSWTPSAKTSAVTRYYDSDPPTAAPRGAENGSDRTLASGEERGAPQETLDREDGEEAGREYGRSVMALAKVKPAEASPFGCILTAVSARWALTAASCLEAVDEMDSVESRAIVQRYGERGREAALAVSDVRVHPLYEGGNRSYDLAAVRASAPFRGAFLPLASPLDSLLWGVGDAFSVLGFGPFRSPARSASRGLRAARVVRVAARACAEESGGAALRHLWAGRAAAAGSCARAALCAGPLRRRVAPCNYCAGAPLVRRRALLALMADNPRCGLSCEPALYVNVADLADWILSVVRHE